MQWYISIDGNGIKGSEAFPAWGKQRSVLEATKRFVAELKALGHEVTYTEVS